MMKKFIRILLPIFVFLALFLPVFAIDEYVRDDYGVLTQEEIQQLNQKAARISQEQQCGIYIRVMPNREGEAFIEDYAEIIYKRENLGIGPDKNGILLILDMNERYYDIAAYGDRSNRAFTDFAKSIMEDDIVERMSKGNYYEAFNYYLDDSEYDLQREAMGEPVDVNHVHTIAEQKAQKRRVATTVAGTVSPLTSLLICLGLRSRNKSKGLRYDAVDYIPRNGIQLNVVSDQFLYRREHRTPRPKVQSSSGGGFGDGGTTINSGGFSHSSGKF